MSIVLIDTVGEYCAIHEPTDDRAMLQALERRGLEPGGVEDTHIYHLVGREPSNPKHRQVSPFSLRFSELSPYAVQEILELTEAQSERFFKAYDVTKLALERMGIWPTNEQERRMLMELDELDSAYPEMTLCHLYDVINEIEASVDKDAEEPYVETPIFRSRRKELQQLIAAASPPKNVISWRALRGKLGRIKRLKIFDSPSAPALNYAKLLRPGHVTILDLSDTDSPVINNLVIAELLRGVQAQQEENYKTDVARGKQPTPTLIFIEEAHEFLSAQRIQKMQVLFQQVARIARRGRNAGWAWSSSRSCPSTSRTR
jgi:DNA helicase HerA-like ATPase